MIRVRRGGRRRRKGGSHCSNPITLNFCAASSMSKYSPVSRFFILKVFELISILMIMTMTRGGRGTEKRREEEQKVSEGRKDNTRRGGKKKVMRSGIEWNRMKTTKGRGKGLRYLRASHGGGDEFGQVEESSANFLNGQNRRWEMCVGLLCGQRAPRMSSLLSLCGSRASYR
jgi:hypothetical protein